jgi:FMN reductase
LVQNTAPSVIADLVAVNGSPSSSSRTAAIALAAVQENGVGRVLHLGTLDAAALLARSSASDVDEALAAMRGAGALVVATPVYRRTYSGILKTLFDLFESDALAGIPVIPAATAGGPADALCIDHGLRPLIASLGGWATPTAVYATHADFVDGAPGEAVLETLRRGLAEAAVVAASRKASRT